MPKKVGRKARREQKKRQTNMASGAFGFVRGEKPTPREVETKEAVPTAKTEDLMRKKRQATKETSKRNRNKK